MPELGQHALGALQPLPGGQLLLRRLGGLRRAAPGWWRVYDDDLVIVSWRLARPLVRLGRWLRPGLVVARQVNQVHLTARGHGEGESGTSAEDCGEEKAQQGQESREGGAHAGFDTKLRTAPPSAGAMLTALAKARDGALNKLADVLGEGSEEDEDAGTVTDGSTGDAWLADTDDDVDARPQEAPSPASELLAAAARVPGGPWAPVTTEHSSEHRARPHAGNGCVSLSVAAKVSRSPALFTQGRQRARACSYSSPSNQCAAFHRRNPCRRRSCAQRTLLRRRVGGSCRSAAGGRGVQASGAGSLQRRPGGRASQPRPGAAVAAR